MWCKFFNILVNLIPFRIRSISLFTVYEGDFQLEDLNEYKQQHSHNHDIQPFFYICFFAERDNWPFSSLCVCLPSLLFFIDLPNKSKSSTLKLHNWSSQPSLGYLVVQSVSNQACSCFYAKNYLLAHFFTKKKPKSFWNWIKI